MDFLDGLQELDKETRDAVFAEFERIDPSGLDVALQEKIFFGLLGVVSMEHDFEQFRINHPNLEPLEVGQHPENAHYGPSTPDGAEKFVGLMDSHDANGIGSSSIGESLVVRTANSIFYEMDGTLSADADTFMPLINVKKINEFTFAKNNISDTIRHAVDYYRSGCLESGGVPQKLSFLPAILVEDARNYAKLVSEANRKGEAYYKGMGINVDGLDENQKLATFASVEDMMREKGLYDASELAVKASMLPIYHEEHRGEHYVFLKESNRFIRVPSLDEGRGAIETFKSKLPGYVAGADEKTSKSAWIRKSQSIIEGYTEYLKAREESLQLSDLATKHDFIDICADSRTNLRMFMGAGRLRQRTMMYVYRSAGNPYFDSRGNMTKPAQRYLGTAALNDGYVSHTAHGNCGAINFAWDTCDGKSGIPDGFVRYGVGRKEAYEIVVSKGGSSDAIMDAYTEETGIPFHTVLDCLAFESIRVEYSKIRKISGSPEVVGMFQNTSGRTIHFENVNGVNGEKAYIRLPYIKGLEKLVLSNGAKISPPVRNEITGRTSFPVSKV